MNTELVYIAIMMSGGALFALGGTGKWFLASKAWRRFGVPIAFQIALLALKVNPIVSSAVALTLCAVLHLGYGESKSWGYKALVGCSYAIPSLFIGLTYWQILAPVIFLVLFALSNWKWTAKDFFWKACEFSYGFLIALTVIGALQRPWGFV